MVVCPAGVWLSVAAMDAVMSLMVFFLASRRAKFDHLPTFD